MKNKKAQMFRYIIAAALGLFLLYIFVGPIITDIFVKKQVAFLSGQTERTTQDCDEDDVMGVTDSCPCNPNIIEKADNQRCGTPSNIAENNCPALCKK